MTWEQALEEYQLYLTLERSIAENSRVAYIHDIRRYGLYASAILEVQDPGLMTLDGLREFLTFLVQDCLSGDEDSLGKSLDRAVQSKFDSSDVSVYVNLESLVATYRAFATATCEVLTMICAGSTVPGAMRVESIAPGAIFSAVTAASAMAFEDTTPSGR